MASDPFQFVREPRYDDLLGAIEDFAARYFTLPVPERESAWDRLNAQAGKFPLLADRLANLAAGLAIDPAALACDGDVREIVDAVLRAYLLPPKEQAEFCRAKQAEFANPRGQLAANLVREKHPDVAGLTPLVESIPRLDKLPSEENSALTFLSEMFLKPMILVGVAGVVVACSFLWETMNKKNRRPDPNAARRANQALVDELKGKRNTALGMEILRAAEEERALFKLEPKFGSRIAMVDQLVARQEVDPDPELAETIARRAVQMKADGFDEYDLEWMRRAEVVRFELRKRSEQAAPR